MKSFATSICPIKKSSRSEYDASPHHPRIIPAPYHHHPRAIPPSSPRHPRAIPARRDHHPTDLKTVSFRCHNRSSARRPCLQLLQSHLRVAKQSSIGPSARRPCLQMPQWHPRVAKRSSDRSRSGHLSMIMPVFGTTTLPSGASEPSPRGEGVF